MSEDENKADEQPIRVGDEEEEEVIEDPQPLGKFRFQANRKRVKGDQAFLICSEGKCVRPSSLLNVEPKQVYSLSQRTNYYLLSLVRPLKSLSKALQRKTRPKLLIC